jgi:hypothetical protein
MYNTTNSTSACPQLATFVLIINGKGEGALLVISSRKRTEWGWCLHFCIACFKVTALLLCRAHHAGGSCTHRPWARTHSPHDHSLPTPAVFAQAMDQSSRRTLASVGAKYASPTKETMEMIVDATELHQPNAAPEQSGAYNQPLLINGPPQITPQPYK